MGQGRLAPWFEGGPDFSRFLAFNRMISIVKTPWKFLGLLLVVEGTR